MLLLILILFSISFTCEYDYICLINYDIIDEKITLLEICPYKELHLCKDYFYSIEGTIEKCFLFIAHFFRS